MISGISHFAIKVRDLAAAERFYCDVLGLEVERRWPNAEGTGPRSIWLRAGDDAGTFLALEIASRDPAASEPVAEPVASTTISPPTGGERPGHHLLALRIRGEQRARFEARLAAAGVLVSHRTAFTLYFTDPEGNRLGLSHYPDPKPPNPAGPG